MLGLFVLLFEFWALLFSNESPLTKEKYYELEYPYYNILYIYFDY